MTAQELPELLPCPWCGERPTIANIRADENQGTKWGGVVCCTPEVRTHYEPVEKWAERAIEAWNDRAALAGAGAVAWRFRHPVDGDVGTWHDVNDEPVNGPHMQKFQAEGCDIEYAFTHPAPVAVGVDEDDWYMNWFNQYPDDIRKKLSLHDLRRMLKVITAALEAKPHA